MKKHFPSTELPLILIGLIIGGALLTSIFFVQKKFSQPKNDFQGTSSQLTRKLEMGPTTLNVQDLAIMRKFYEQTIGLTALESDEQSVTLGSNSRQIIKLVEEPELASPQRSAAGLYHNAILFSSRAGLAQRLAYIFQTEPTRFSGSSDHRVSEAFYFTDPEDNGLELYFDKDPSAWQWRDNQIVMGSSYIDPQQYIETYGKASASPESKMGHVHLKVGDILSAKKFYVEILGLSITSEREDALFVSDGYYHHNLAMNTWESAGAGARTNSLGLKSFELFVETDEDLTKLKQRLQQNDTSFTENNKVIEVADPWKNIIFIRKF